MTSLRRRLGREKFVFVLTKQEHTAERRFDVVNIYQAGSWPSSAILVSAAPSFTFMTMSKCMPEQRGYQEYSKSSL